MAMTRDDFKNLLLEERDDRAGQIEQAVSEFSDALYTAEDATRQLDAVKAELDKARETIGQITETNMKLLEKVKYAEDTTDKGGNDGGNDGDSGEFDPENISIDDLFRD